MVTIAGSTKLWAFEMAEQLESHGMLDKLFTSYAYSKNTLARRFIRRVDKENIPNAKIETNLFLAFPIGAFRRKAFLWNMLFDKWVALKLRKSNSKIFIGWSGMCLNSIRAAKKRGMITIVERGSSHIQFQNSLLSQEYKNYGIRFRIHPDVIRKEMKEYEEADYISVPSLFVKRTFLEKGIPERKLFLNPYGVKADFTDAGIQAEAKPPGIFKILYLGSLSYRKGLPYLFEALNLLSIPLNQYEVCFIGKIEKGFDKYCKSYRKQNWEFLGHIDHNELPRYLRDSDISVVPSIEDGFGMVIPQLMANSVPVITTTNTGGSDLIRDGENGFVVPVRDPRAIAQRIEFLYGDPEKLELMKKQALMTVLEGNTWKDYGNRYMAFLKILLKRGEVRYEE